VGVSKELCNEINQALGVPGLIVPASEVSPISFIPTGIFSFDKSMIGIPRGRLTSIEGHPGSFKTSFALRVAANAGTTVYMDCEHASNRDWIARFVDLDNIAITMPNTMEEAYNAAMMIASEKQFDLLIIDSISALAPMDELEKDQEDSPIMAKRAQITNRFIRDLNSYLGKDDSITVIGINHLMSTMNAYGKQYSVPCGRTQQFLTSLRILLRPVSKIKDDEDNEIGWNMQWIEEKRKIAARTSIGSFDAFKAEGYYCGRHVKPGDIDELQAITESLVAEGKISKRGTWYEVCGEKCQGTKNLRPLLLAHGLIDMTYAPSIISPEDAVLDDTDSELEDV